MLDPSSPATARPALSRREAEVLDLVSGGLTNIEVADRLDIGPHAVKYHLRSIFRKLGVANRTEATGVYLRSGISVRATRDREETA